MNKRSFLKTLGVLMAGAPMLPSVLSNLKKTRTNLLAEWTFETDQNLQCFYGIDAEKMLMAALSREIQREIDEELINRMINI